MTNVKSKSFSIFVSVVFSLAIGAQASAQSATTTALSISATSAPWMTAVTLTATVTGGSKPVTPGVVKFCNANGAACFGPAFLGQAQLTANGTASIKVVLPIGTYSIKAEFAGTKTNTASNSNAETFTVTGGRVSTTSFSVSGTSPYTLTTTVNGYGLQAVNGNVSFVDTSDSNYSLGTEALVPGTTSQVFSPHPGTGAGSEPTSLVTGDFNNDGYPDLVLGDVNPNSSGYSTLALYFSAGKGNYNATATLNLPMFVSGVSALAAGDFNTDGNLDLAVATGNNYVVILLGDGKGDFFYNAALTTGTGPDSIAVADFNGDGNLDLAVTNQFSSTATILLGNGQGGFSNAPSSPQTGSYPYSVAAEDFNGDGIPDLAVANYYGSDVTILLGKGDGTFTSASNSPAVGIYPVAVAIGDFNEDGKQDLAVVNQFSKTVSILLGDGKGDFSAASTSPVTGNAANSVAVADFNGDGIQDLAIANASDNTVMVFLGKGDGTFPSASVETVQLPGGTAPSAITPLDFNADGFQDFAAAGAASSTLVLGENTVTTSASATLAGITVPGGGTHNLVANYSGNATYAPSTSGAISIAGTPITTNVALNAEPAGTVAMGQTVQLTAILSPSVAGNLSAGGTVTFVGGNYIQTVPVAQGIAVFNATMSAAGPVTFTAKYSGDTNFLASTSAASSLKIVAPTASGTTLAVSSNSVTKGTIVTLTATVTDAGSPVTQGMVEFCNAAAKFCQDSAILGTAHLNASGTAAIKLALPVGKNLIKAVFAGTDEMNSSSSSTQTVTVSVSSAMGSTSTLSLSGSPGNYTFSATVAGSWPAPTGKVSFVDTSNKNLPLGTATLIAGLPVLTQSAAPATGSSPMAATVADFNGDGKPDIALANYSSNSLTILLGNGGGTFTAKASPISGNPNFNFPWAIASGDFNGDGKPDLAVANHNSNGVTILLGNGDGTFTVKATPAVGAEPVSIAVADFNGDGRLDLAVANFSSNSVTILLGNGDGTFTADPVSPATGVSPFALVQADFNSDGKADLAVANANDTTILLGNGDGTFSPVETAIGGGSAIVALDFNQDGRPDLAITNFYANTVTIFAGLGDGSFFPMFTYPTDDHPLGIVAADLNGDGYTDLVVTNRSSGTLTVLLNYFQLYEQFLPETVSFPSGSAPYPISVGDFNQDGSPDLAIGDVNLNTALILLNSATASASVTNISVPRAGTHEVEAVYSGVAPYAGSTSTAVAATATAIPTTAVVNAPNGAIGQNIPITVSILPASADNFSTTGTASLYSGSTLLGTATVTNGQASFSEMFGAAGVYSLTAKYSGNTEFAASTSGVTPLYVAPAATTSLTVSANAVSSGTPVTLTAAVSSGGKSVMQGVVTFYDNATQLATAGLTTNGSATAKLVLGIGTHSLKAVFAGTTADAGSSSSLQTVTVTGLYATTTALTDSLVSGTYTLTAKVMGASPQTPAGTVSFVDMTNNTTLGTAVLGSGATNLSFAASTLTAGAGPQGVAVADFNRDGILDVAISNTGPGTVTIFLGNGKGAFTAEPAISVGNGDPTAIAVGDFNADGIPDLAIANYNGGTVTVLLGNGDGTFTAKSTLTADGNPIALAVGDFNLDGKLDFAVTTGFGHSVNVFLGNGDGTFIAGTSFIMNIPRGIAVGDFNGDGKPDLAVSAYYANAVIILLGDGAGNFAQVASIPTGNRSWPVAVGDFNGDGKLDFAVANSADGTLTIALGNGNGTFGNPSTISLGAGTQPQGLVAADFNQDGKLDLVVAETGKNKGVILLGNGNGAFTLQSTPIATGAQPWSIAVGDFNGDGKPDFAVPNSGSSNVSVLLNSLTTTAIATLSGATISGTGSQSLEAKYPGNSVYAASTSNALSLPPM